MLKMHQGDSNQNRSAKINQSNAGAQFFQLIHFAASIVTILASGVLIFFNLRRLFFIMTVLFGKKRIKNRRNISVDSNSWPEILILIPCRDEEEMITGLYESVCCLDYPKDKTHVVFINDGSVDKTGAIMEQFAHCKQGWHVLHLKKNGGKSAALNAAINQYSYGEIIYIFDADHRPKPDALRLAVRYFDDPLVAGVSGQTIPLNPMSSSISYYETVEASVHQLVTMQAKDQLDLAPALLGSNCGYRRKALVECGGFRNGVFLEDTDLTLAFYRAGYKTRFAEEAISYHQVPNDLDGYIKQHSRWARGFNEVAKQHILGLVKNNKLSFLLRTELLMFSVGYLDRVALFILILMKGLSYLFPRLPRVSGKLLSFTLLSPFIQIIGLFVKYKISWAMWLRLPFIGAFYALDVFVAIRAMTNTVLKRQPVWLKTKRIRI
jgi:cellulose synthase/poly-beta-1,6-N-acetylglucosamine synthase-like glycosyltransferase